MGSDQDEIDALVPADDSLREIPFRFWDSWLDERNHSFPGFYKDIRQEDWPALAESIARSLEDDLAIQDPRLLNSFPVRSKAGVASKNMRVRLVVTLVTFFFLIVLHHLQFGGPINDHMKWYCVIAIGFLFPSLLFRGKSVGTLLVISFLCISLAGMVWRVWSRSSVGSWDFGSMIVQLIAAFISFGIAIFVNERAIGFIERKSRRISL